MLVVFACVMIVCMWCVCVGGLILFVIFILYNVLVNVYIMSSCAIVLVCGGDSGVGVCVCLCGSTSGGGGFFLACKDFLRMSDHSFSRLLFFFFF